LLERTARLMEGQVAAGDGSPLLAAQARIAFNRAQLASRESDRAIAIARSQLAEAVGVPPLALVDVRLSYRDLGDGPRPVVGSEVRNWAATNRADLLLELAAYAAAESALQGEIARQYPDLTFGPAYELDQGEGKWSLALGVALPVFHQNQGPIAAASARREIAAARFLMAQNRVLAEVDRALSDYASVMGDLETVDTLRTNLERQERIVSAQQRAGETSQLDLARARIELADNARTGLEARVRAERAIATLEDAVQRPLDWPESAWRKPWRSGPERSPAR
jgi:outer membrane protein, heavy metal efflux system